MIPKKIFQSHKSLNYVVNDKILSEYTNSWKKHYKTYQYNFYDDQRCDSFMKEYFSGETYDIYTKMPIPVMKSDLWRYCIIYHYGGIYADTDLRINTTPDIFINPNSEISIAVEPMTNFFVQFAFAAEPKSPILKSVIDVVLQNMKNYIKDGVNYLNKDWMIDYLKKNMTVYNNNGINFSDKNWLIKEIQSEWIVHYLTGPAAFRKGVETYLEKNNLKTFAGNREYENYYDKRIYFFPTNEFSHKLISHFCKGFFDGWRNERDKKMNL
jgi:hypothetical protein